ncbi:MAG: winged helix-turn-helix transcriptional regulator [Nanoarchaeota archaeon]
MDQIKDSFLRVKEDILNIKKEIFNLQKELKSNREFMIEICEIVKKISENSFNQQNLQNTQIKKNQKNCDSNLLEKNLENPTYSQTHNQTSQESNITDRQQINNQTHQEITPTDRQQTNPYPTDTSTHNCHIKPLNDQNQDFSTGNGGVPTDRQTDRQTDRHIKNTQNSSHNPETRLPKQDYNSSQNSVDETSSFNQVDNASELLESLDSIKKELRLKFKRLTDQEMLVFSTLYQLDQESENREEQGTNYREIADKLNLSESSIRDYVGRLIKKGVPIFKQKLNNKAIFLSISNNFKKIASLETLLKLREI